MAPVSVIRQNVGLLRNVKTVLRSLTPSVKTVDRELVSNER
jgi:hypothetical protein